MYLFLFWLTVALQAVCLPLYIDFRFDKIPFKLQKMICSTLFLLAALFAFLYAGRATAYPALVGAALILSWIGDLVLSSSSESAQFAAGLGGFLAAHILFIAAFCVSGNRLYGAEYITVSEIAAAAVIAAAFFLLSRKLKIVFGKMLLPVLLYAAAISLMLVKAAGVGASAISAGAQNAYAILPIMTAAALLFITSDATLVLIIFKNMRSQKTELVNIGTYYIAQMIFAGSIMLLS
ncbi:MAG: lysoplasmalogenase family protein [Oscillospiraceae bacterium]|nr:lysoplasmalogenase family protein [Oscillospiraceae bacterium]